MATMSKGLKECNKGEKCEYHKVGMCKFGHTKTMLKAQPVKKTVVKNEVPAKNVLHIVREFAKRHSVLSRQIAVAGIDSKIRDTYVDVKSSAKEKWADMPETVDMLKEQLTMLRNTARAAIGRKVVKTTLWEVRNAVTSGANTFNQGAVALSPVGLQDWTAFASLYDECRVTAMTMHTRADPSVTGTALPVIWGACLDPADASVISNVPDILSAQYSTGPLLLGGGSVAPANPYMNMHNGLARAHMPLPAGRLTDTVTTGVVGGGWFGTDSASTIITGFAKCAIPGIGSTGVSSWSALIEYHVEFRDRN